MVKTLELVTFYQPQYSHDILKLYELITYEDKIPLIELNHFNDHFYVLIDGKEIVTTTLKEYADELYSTLRDFFVSDSNFESIFIENYANYKNVFPEIIKKYNLYQCEYDPEYWFY